MWDTSELSYIQHPYNTYFAVFYCGGIATRVGDLRWLCFIFQLMTSGLTQYDVEELQIYSGGVCKETNQLTIRLVASWSMLFYENKAATIYIVYELFVVFTIQGNEVKCFSLLSVLMKCRTHLSFINITKGRFANVYLCYPFLRQLLVLYWGTLDI